MNLIVKYQGLEIASYRSKPKVRKTRPIHAHSKIWMEKNSVVWSFDFLWSCAFFPNLLTILLIVFLLSCIAFFIHCFCLGCYLVFIKRKRTKKKKKIQFFLSCVLESTCTHKLVKKLILLTCIPHIAWLSTLYAHTMLVNQVLNFVWYLTKNLWLNYLSLLSLSLMKMTIYLFIFLRERHKWLTTYVCQLTYPSAKK